MVKVEYRESIQKSLVVLYYRGYTKYSICKEYGISRSMLNHWIELYFGEKKDSSEVMTFLQLRELKKQKEKLEQEISILSEAITLFESP